MNAKQFHKTEFQKLRPPTERKIVNAARRANLTDTLSELIYWLGTYVSEVKLEEFAARKLTAKGFYR